MEMKAAYYSIGVYTVYVQLRKEPVRMRIFTYLIVFILVIIGFAFACLNAESVTINYYLGQREIPLSLLLAAGLFIGGFLG